MERSNADRGKTGLLLAALGGSRAGLPSTSADGRTWPRRSWLVGVLPVLAALLVEILRSMWR
jgi:hypothetical protein